MLAQQGGNNNMNNSPALKEVTQTLVLLVFSKLVSILKDEYLLELQSCGSFSLQEATT
jgi:hypothetical protein